MASGSWCDGVAEMVYAGFWHQQLHPLGAVTNAFLQAVKRIDVAVNAPLQ
jgi:hypothetical protein